VYYGGVVAGPVFKEIAEKVFSSSVDFIKPINTTKNFLTKVPNVITTKSNELNQVTKFFGLPTVSSNSEGYVIQSVKDSTKINVSPINFDSQLKKGIMPNLSGLSAKDALFLLENNGVYVKLQGFGSVKKQSIEAGQKFNKGNKIILTLS
jgi:cell division protein FtsI (penicillin-binding protein 3)